MSAQDNLPRFSFGGYVFPVEDYEVKGGQRLHVHEYSHQDGGDPELLGRKLYEISCVGNFQATFALYPNLWPNILLKLLKLFEEGTTADLIVPSRGVIQAFAVGWSQKWSAKIRSGEKVPILFHEAASNLPLEIQLSQSSNASIDTTASLAAAQALNAQLDAKATSIFDALQTVVHSITAVRDTAEMYGNLVTARCSQAIALCQQLDQDASVQDPTNVQFALALHQLWAQTVKFSLDVQSKGGKVLAYVTTSDMSVQRVSTVLFGSTVGVTPLLSMNSGVILDPTNIPAGTELVYYAPSQNASS